MPSRKMSEDDDNKIADRMRKILGPLDPFDRIRHAGLTFAVVGVQAGFDDEILLAAIRGNLALIRAVKRESHN